MHHVPDVVQQRRGDQGGVFALCLRQQRRLQRVLPLVDIAQPVLTMSLAVNDRSKFIEARIVHVHFIQLSLVTCQDIAGPPAQQSAIPRMS